MKKLSLALIALLLCIQASAQLTEDKSNPGSLFKTQYENPFLDRIARKAGDVLTILISEQSIATLSASTKANKADTNNVATAFFNGFLERITGALTPAATSTVSGDGETKQNSTMTARMSAIIKEVLPNGNMVIEGTRSLVTNKETQTYKLTGMIRPESISADNTVKSEAIANAEIKMEGKGMIAERQRKGILTQLLDWLF
jgi:flagellar L-ring protein precursor FlgH